MRYFLAFFLLFYALSAQADFSAAPQVPKLLAMLRHQAHFTEKEIEWVRTALRKARALPHLLTLEEHPKERTLTWGQYAPIHINPENIRNGITFMHRQHHWLQRAYREYGVPPVVITALLGVETKYGRDTGNIPVLDALSTLAFDYPPQEPFFLRELEQFFVFCHNNHINPTKPKGSYAGAMGDAQFMPSSVLQMGVDFNHDGKINLWSTADAVGSVANYLTHFDPKYAWQRGKPLMVRARAIGEIPTTVKVNAKHPTDSVSMLIHDGIKPLSPVSVNQKAGLVVLKDGKSKQDWIVFNNFYAIMSYNPHILYAMAVAQLARALKHAEYAVRANRQ